MNWKQILVQLNKTDVDEVSDWLIAQGAQAVTFEDAEEEPILEPAPGETPMWDRVILTALFDEVDAVSKISIQLKKQFNGIIQSTKITLLEDQLWERAWMDGFKAMQFGERLWICPSWEVIPEPDAVNIILDPGLAFGSGTHETTALCLKWLEALDIENKSVLDYGCGSGILAIAAVKLGAKKVTGIDNDPQAILASRENAKRNNITEQQFCLLQVSADSPPTVQTVDILVANILAEPLRNLAANLAMMVKPGGQFALSGLLREQVKEIMGIYQEWFIINPVEDLGNWSLVSGIRR